MPQENRRTFYEFFPQTRKGQSSATTEALSTAEQIQTKETPLRKRPEGNFGILVACSKRPLADKRFSNNTKTFQIFKEMSKQYDPNVP